MIKKIRLGLLVIVLVSCTSAKPLEKTTPPTYEVSIVTVPQEYILCNNAICDSPLEKDACPKDCLSEEEYDHIKEDRFTIIVPKGYELLAEKHLQDLKTYYPLISGFLGITPFYNTTFLKIRQDTFNVGSSNGRGIFYVRTPENLRRDLQEVETNSSEGFLFKSSQTYCANTHEFVHVFVGHLNLPQWANEGITEYTQKQVQNGSKDYFECRDNGWYGTDYWGDGKEKWFAYSDLGGDYGKDDGAGPKWYRTAMCFWEYVDKIYGKEKIKEIFQQNDQLLRENKVTTDRVYVDEILVPILGEEVKNILAQRFGVNN